MQISKAGVVAAGAIATVAAMGSAAAAAPPALAQKDASKTATTTLGIGKAQVDRQIPVAEPGAGQPLISIGTSSKISVLAWEPCGSTTVAGVGGTVAAGSPHTVIGDCNNSNARLQQDNTQGLISILDDTAVRVAPWQVCGSHVVAGVGVTAAVGSPALVTGDCNNANTLIEAPEAPGASSLISVLSGSVINVLPWQVCGSSAVMGVGAVVAQNSPTTVLGDCTNGGIKIEPRPNPAAIAPLSNTPLNILPLQVCETNSLASLVGVVLPLGSPAFVGGTCYVPDGLPDGLDLGQP